MGVQSDFKNNLTLIKAQYTSNYVSVVMKKISPYLHSIYIHIVEIHTELGMYSLIIYFEIIQIEKIAIVFVFVSSVNLFMYFI